MVEACCQDCGVTFVRRSDQFNRPGRTASVRCAHCAKVAGSTARTYPERRTGVIVQCAQCGIDVYRNPSDAALGRKVFCNRACHVEWNRQQPRMPIPKADNRGKRNGRYRHGQRTGEHITKPKVRRVVASRDGDYCLLCGKPPPSLHLHRVCYGSEGGQYESTNCVQLCALHHDVVHSDKRIWKPMLLDYLSHAGAEQRLLAEVDLLRLRDQLVVRKSSGVPG